MKMFLQSLLKKLPTLAVLALFASNLPAQQASPEGAARKADPQAYALLKSARDHSQSFPDDFTGFSADLIYHEESKTATGKLEFVTGSGLQIEANDLSDERRAWLQRALGSLIMHRRGGDFGQGDGKYPLTFGPEEHHPLGRLIFLNDKLQSSYRVGDGIITEVNRTMGPEKFTITILETTPADPGKHLPRHFVVNYFDAKTGTVLRSEAFTDQYVKVDQVWLPASRRIVRAEGGKVTTRLIELRNYRLKPAQTSNRSGDGTIDWMRLF